MPNKNKPKKQTTFIGMLVLVFFLSLGLQIMSMSEVEPEKVNYNQFLEFVEDKKVEKVIINLYDSTFSFVDTEGANFLADNPKTEEFKEFLLLNDIEVKEIEDSNSGAFIMSSLQLLLYAGIIFFMFKKMMPGQKNDELVENVPKITFDDIAGEKELKEDLQFVIEYLKNPKKYEEMGARMPKGIILYGPPGTGKTLTAKAIAGSAGVPFFQVSGSDFVEMYVGLGAKRVRDLYKKAKQKAPCIVFVDEIDAVGGERNSKTSHSENNQTINALLNELDGFSGSEGVLTICATNLLESLDPALIRPGRFDKQMAVPMPEKEDRLEILKVHARGKKIAEDVDFEAVASMTVGFSGASIESMLNEAAFIAVNLDKKAIDMEDIDHAFYKIVMKGDKKRNQNSRDKEELKLVAWHEAAHALATKLYTKDSVPKITIIASTSGAGGVTFRNPQEMSLWSKQYIKNLIKVMYAGRAGEKCYTQDDDLITTGASNDIKQATMIIKEYMVLYGMHEKYGMLNLETFQSFDNHKIIEEAASLSKELYSSVEADMLTHVNVLKEIADYLLANESMEEAALDEILLKHGLIETSICENETDVFEE